MLLLMSLEALAKLGAIVSSAGIGLIVAFVVVLLAFPVIKKCDEDGKCSYRSTAPLQLQSIVRPSFLAICLLSISAGVLMLRFSRRREREKTERGT